MDIIVDKVWKRRLEDNTIKAGINTHLFLREQVANPIKLTDSRENSIENGARYNYNDTSFLLSSSLSITIGKALSEDC